MQTNSVEKTFCTTREAAALLGVSVGTVQLWVENGLLKAWKTSGGHRRVLRHSLELLLHKKSDLPNGELQGATAQGRSDRLRVIVVEDDAALRHLYEVQLARWPMRPEVTAVDNAVSALLLMGRGGPDLLITDLRMTGMNGFEMARLLRKAPEAANTTIVVVTGLSSAEIERHEPIAAGVEVLPKPVPFERLLAIATNIVKTKSK
ncbi:MAG: response regulator [Comamonadaceae bacterium]